MKNKTTKKTGLAYFSLKILLWIIALAAAGTVILIAIWNSAVKAPDSEKNAITMQIDIPEGMSVKDAAELLEQKKLIKSSRALYIAARLSSRFTVFNSKKPFALKSGSYTISSSMKLEEIYRILQSGNQIYIAVVIPEGLTISQTGKILEEKGVCTLTAFREAAASPELIAKYNIPDFVTEEGHRRTLEGYLFPDTYFLTPKMNAMDVADKLVSTFFEKIKEIDGLSEKSPEELAKIVNLASIVQCEYESKDEAPVIASVFTNRMKYNIGFYSCATVEYILTEFRNEPHKKYLTTKGPDADTKINDSYNTYMWAGLPPGPISNPGKIALSAALNPAKTNYYFFVANGNGTHTFTSNLDQHNEAKSSSDYYSGN